MALRFFKIETNNAFQIKLDRKTISLGEGGRFRENVNTRRGRGF